MALLGHARGLILRPNAEWAAIAAEPSSRRAILFEYVLPLVAAGALVTIEYNLVQMKRGPAIGSAVFQIVVYVVNVYLVAWLADLLVKRFGGVKDPLAAFKWVAYASTPMWLAQLGFLIPNAQIADAILCAGLGFSGYLLFLGANADMHVPPGRSVWFTLSVIALYFFFGAAAFAVLLLIAIAGSVPYIGG